MLFNYLFSKKQDCSHSKVPLDVDCAYCPDCGELVETRWFVLRCDCCGSKIPATIRNGKIVPVNKHCTNCGSDNFSIEELEKVNFINVSYAVAIKQVVQPEDLKFTQSWVEITKEQKPLRRLELRR